MTCPNFNVKIIKMHDTKFWCCDKMKFDIDNNGWATMDDYLYIHQWNWCPHCGRKLTMFGS